MSHDPVEQRVGQASIAIDLAHGCRLSSLEVHGRELLVQDREGPLRWGCYPMAPWVGRTRLGRFEFGGRTYQLPINLGPHAIHGTVFGSEWRPLDPPFVFETDTGPNWPFPGVVRQEIRLSENRLDLRLEISSNGGAMPAACGWHPWFRSVVDGSRAIQHLKAGHMFVRDQDGISTPDKSEVPDPPWDDCFGDVTWPVLINWPDSLTLAIGSDLPFVVVYNEEPDAFCVEPQSAPPNSLNNHPYIVEPGRPLVANAHIAWQPAAPGQ
jgi:galactose mutarotase-like enzyme